MSNESVVNQINRSNMQPGSAKPMAARKVDTGGTPPHGNGKGQSQKPLPPLVSSSGNPNPPNYNPRADEG